MSPEQFLELARVLPEPLLLITGRGEILAANQPTATILDLNVKEIVGRMLFDFVIEPREKIISYLQACSRSRQMILSSLTLRQQNGETIIYRCEGAVLQPSSPECVSLNVLRLKKRASASNNFILLNEKIKELTKEIQQRKQVEENLCMTNDILQKTLYKLQATQIQLIQTEKMSSLGQLVAGIAHEINNPMNFIHGNIFHASEYIQNLLGLVQLYQQEYPDPSQEIQEEIAAINLDFIKQDLNQLLESMRVGTDRICEIVKSLRTFARVDEAEIKNVDIHSGIDSTLVILQHRLKAKPESPKIEVVKEYGELPVVNCYPGQLNQVFMNILSNAIDALEESFASSRLPFIENKEIFRDNVSNKSKGLGVVVPELSSPNQTVSQMTEPEILIRTEVLNDSWIAIRIADNGPGMTERVRQQVFDPFFTTKPVGKGMGLGLSICYQIIVEKHGGQLHCASDLGRGTEFCIQIPISQIRERSG
ncbi:ATP-binding protein [Aetokthonos hydrillicola]|nr:PAS domain-containing protein [Aetokthonos hydrillicola CCALA 1050]MBW4583689.1 PAS domain-containing protein [Aetokthonos hydrillicola CCALA 1050]